MGKTMKLGGVSISKDDIVEALCKVMDITFMPVTLKPKEGKYDSLQAALCSEKVPFMKASDFITTHIDTQKVVPLHIFFTSTPSNEEIATSLFTSIKQEIVQQFDIGMEEKVQGQSVETHKESYDRYHVRKLLVTLSGDEECNSISFGDEVYFRPDEQLGPSGLIDLLIGSRQSSDATADLLIKFEKEVVIGISNTTLSETKSTGKPLSRKAPSEDLLKTVSQPVLVLLSVAQISKSSGPHLLFYANRHHIRPFLYYKGSDVLLTTNKAIMWMNEDEGVLELDGVCLVALLLRSNRAVKFVNETDMSYFLTTEMSFPDTGFKSAMTLDLTKAELKCSCIPQQIPDKTSDKQRYEVMPRKDSIAVREKFNTFLSKKRRLED